MQSFGYPYSQQFQDCGDLSVFPVCLDQYCPVLSLAVVHVPVLTSHVSVQDCYWFQPFMTVLIHPRQIPIHSDSPVRSVWRLL